MPELPAPLKEPNQDTECLIEPAPANGSKHSFWKKPENFIQLATLIFVATYTIFTGAQMYFSTRAFIFPKEIRVDQIGSQNVLVVDWENSGSTPTTDLKAHIQSSFENDELAPGFSWQKIVAVQNSGKLFDDVPIAIGPKSTSSISYMALPQGCVDGFQNRSIPRLYIWGRATYRDSMFGFHHETRFCYDVTGFTLSQSGQGKKIVYALCGEGNCIDRECGSIKKPDQIPMLPVISCPAPVQQAGQKTEPKH